MFAYLRINISLHVFIYLYKTLLISFHDQNQRSMTFLCLSPQKNASNVRPNVLYGFMIQSPLNTFNTLKKTFKEEILVRVFWFELIERGEKKTWSPLFIKIIWDVNELPNHAVKIFGCTEILSSSIFFYC